MLRIGIVAGEPSGDNLGADLIASIKKSGVPLQVEGIGGENLIREGCRSLFDMERLSVMGLFEIVSRYFELLSIQRQIKKYFLENPPDVFIGIDAPDFTLSIEKTLREAGIKTVHYVSPSVWAWRQYRLKFIAKSTDLMMTLFPFEEQYYQEQNIAVKCVGHPLAHSFPEKVDRTAARDELALENNATIIALLPGSRSGEIKRLVEPFLKACMRCREQNPQLIFVAALRDKRNSDLFSSIKSKVAPELDVQIVEGKTQAVLAASDVVLLASGTATLETLLMKRPMVVAYKANWFTYKIIKPLLKVPYVSLPNLIAEEKLVHEFLQHDCTPENLADALMLYLEDKEKTLALKNRFVELHKELVHSDPDSAGNAVLQLLRQ